MIEVVPYYVMLLQGVKSTWVLPDGVTYQNSYFTCLAVSADDGLTFTKPTLNLVEINGSKANNCIWPPGGAQAARHEPGTVFIDENPHALRDERYKMIVSRLRLQPCKTSATVSGLAEEALF